MPKLNYQEIQEVIKEFIKEIKKLDIRVSSYKPLDINKKNILSERIGLELNKYKEIVLSSETGLELGGIENKSFSLIYPIKKSSSRDFSDIIHIIGPEISEIKKSQISFSLFILLSIKNLNDKTYEDLRNLNFISDSIEGFSIRSIPRRFWCRISQDAIENGFSFRFLGNGINSLYREKFRQKINSIQILIINSYPDLIDKWLRYTEEMREELTARWRAKVDNWKKRIDCDYEWACKICPYFKSCQSLQKLLERRKDLEI